MSVGHKPVKKRCVTKKLRPPIDSQRIPATGHEIDQPDVAILQNIVEAVGPAIAQAFRNNDGFRIQHDREPRRISLGGDITRSIYAHSST